MKIVHSLVFKILIFSVTFAGLSWQSTFAHTAVQKVQRSVRRVTRKAPSKSKKSACAPIKQPQKINELPDGSWGGEHISLSKTTEGIKLELDCAHASFSSPIVMNADNCFEVTGSYYKENGGPERPGAPLKGHAALLNGCVVQSSMKLTITLTDLKKSAGAYTLVNGATPRITKCM